jgi:hypothetical protein
VLALPCDVNDEFPIAFGVRIKVTNTGELPLLNVQVCDNKLLQDAADAGLTSALAAMQRTSVALAPGAMTTSLVNSKCRIVRRGSTSPGATMITIRTATPTT